MTHSESQAAPVLPVHSDLRCVPAQVSQALRYLVLEDALCVFELTHSLTFEGTLEPAVANLTARYAPACQQGFALQSAIDAFLAGKATTIERQSSLELVPPAFLAHAQQFGYVAAGEAFQSELTHSASYFELFQSGQAELAHLVVSDYSSHMLFDRKGQVLPTAFHFDYMHGNLRNGAYHLDKAMAVLQNDPRIRPVGDERASRRRKPDDIAWQIHEVPYYNRSAGCHQHLAFMFAPTHEDMLRIWEKAQSYGTSYPSTSMHQAIFDLDILGLRAAGAAKYDTFHGDDAYASDQDDSDDN